MKPEEVKAAMKPEDVKETVVGLVKAHKKPVHIAVLSQLYVKKTGKSIKEHLNKRMIDFVKKECADDLLLTGEGNDTMVRLATPTSVAMAWLKACISENGPILVSMVVRRHRTRRGFQGVAVLRACHVLQVGRMYHEKHGFYFNDRFPEGINKFLQQNMSKDLALETVKGAELLASVPGEDGEDAAGGSVLAARRAEDATAAPYRAGDRILVVGDGDFSFSKALADSLGKKGAAKLVATSYDTEEELLEKYPDTAGENVVAIAARGATVLHGIDAGALKAGELGTGGPAACFDFVLFNFPHTGADEGLADSIEGNRALLKKFFGSVQGVLVEGGEAHVTLVHRYPYTAWKAPEQARTGGGRGLEAAGRVRFEESLFPGYFHKATSQTEKVSSYECETNFTYVWKRTGAPPGGHGNVKRKRKNKGKGGGGEGGGEVGAAKGEAGEEGDHPPAKREKKSTKTKSAKGEAGEEGDHPPAKREKKSTKTKSAKGEAGEEGDHPPAKRKKKSTKTKSAKGEAGEEGDHPPAKREKKSTKTKSAKGEAGEEGEEGEGDQPQKKPSKKKSKKGNE